MTRLGSGSGSGSGSDTPLVNPVATTAAPAKSDKSKKYGLIAGAITVITGVGVAAYVLASGSHPNPSSDWTADLKGHFNGSAIHYNYPCDGQHECVYNFDAFTPVSLNFSGTGNLTDTAGNPLNASFWKWSTRSSVGISALPNDFNQTLLVNNNSTESLRIVANSEGPSPAPLQPPPYCVVSVDGERYATYISPSSVFQNNHVNFSNTPGAYYPFKSTMDIDCSNGALASVNTDEASIHQNLTLGEKPITVSFTTNATHPPKPAHLTLNLSNETVDVATVTYSTLSEDGQYLQKAVPLGIKTVNNPEFLQLAPNSSVTINGAFNHVEVNCTQGSTTLGQGNNVSVPVNGANDVFHCAVSSYPYLNDLNIGFRSSNKTAKNSSLPRYDGACSVYNNDWLVGAIDTYNLSPADAPFSNPRELVVQPSSEVTMECSKDMHCIENLESPLKTGNSQYTFLVDGERPLSLTCATNDSSVNITLMPTHKVIGFYWNGQPINSAGLIYNNDNFQSIHVLPYTQVGFDLIPTAIGICLQNTTLIALGDNAVFNSSDGPTTCFVRSLDGSAQAFLNFTSSASTEGTPSVSASKSGLFKASKGSSNHAQNSSEKPPTQYLRS